MSNVTERTDKPQAVTITTRAYRGSTYLLGRFAIAFARATRQLHRK